MCNIYIYIFQCLYIIVKFSKNNKQMNKDLNNYFKQKGIEIDHNNIERSIIELLEQKQITIEGLSQQITRYKCQQMKNNKLIKQLQDKINLIAPSSSNTGSTFMMASEFKSQFQSFMTTHLSSALGNILDRPYLFSKCIKDIFQYQYSLIEGRITTIINSIAYIMNLQEQNQNNIEIFNKLRTSLINIFQTHWETIFPFSISQLKYQLKGTQEHLQEIVNQVNQLFITQDMIELHKNLHKISVYMILQDKKWYFQKLGDNKIIKYNKKEFTCIDGFIKEGQKALMILQGIGKQDHMHPNLKNYVIPYEQNQNHQEYMKFNLKRADQFQDNNKLKIIHTQQYQNEQKIQPKQVNQSLNIIDLPVQQLQQNSQINLMPNSCLITRNKSNDQLKQNDEPNYPCLKKNKKKQKAKMSLDYSLNEKSPRGNIKRYEQSIKSKIIVKQQYNQLNDKLLIINQAMNRKKNTNNMKILGQNHSNQVSLPLKQKKMILQQLPISKEMNLKKRSKPNTSRKASVGKIVSQNYIINSNNQKDKENHQNNINSKFKNKQKIYKQIIKEKLFDEKAYDKYDKLTNSMNFPVQKSKTDRQIKRKQENRPLKLQSNANKLREKYIFKQ